MTGREESLRDLAQLCATHLKARTLTFGRYRVSTDGRGEAAAEASPEPEPPTDSHAALHALGETAASCTRCVLSGSRRTVVFGEGSPDADLMFVGEAPGRDEDLQGRPFVGRAGQLLTDMIRAMGLRREDVYIANILKCRPPNNRDPAPDEVAACHPYLAEQIRLIRPRVVCGLGRHAVHNLCDVSGGITRIRGRPIPLLEGPTLMPTYHPAYLLRNPAAKREVWEDLKAILRLLGLPVPPPRRRSR